MHVFLPYAGMGIDSQRMRRFLRQVDRLAADLQAAPAGELRRHRTTLMRQRALRAALAPAGLCAFLADGAILARDAGGGPDFRATPLATPAALRRTIDLGRFGRVTGWGIPMGVTALVGAPYHGKSTVLAAIQAGIEDHPPGDGRELVVADVSAVLVQAEDGRRIKDQDTRAFFAALPGADPAHLTTARASGATSMASSILQAVAAGCRLLLIDEDTAAGNVLHVDPVMRKLLGRTFRGTTTIGELLPGLAAAGVSTVMVVGSTGHLLADAGAVVQLDHWQPHDVTRLVRRLVRRHPGRPCSIPSRVLADTPEALQGPRAFVACDLRDVERPRIRLPDGSWTTIDLRRCGWHLDAGVVAGAIAAAGWLCRLAGGVPRPMSMVAADFAHLVARGPTALDPFHGRPLAVPPWQLVVSVLERLPVPWITNEVSESRNGRPPAPLV